MSTAVSNVVVAQAASSSARPTRIDDWLQLPSRQARLAQMPPQLSLAVDAADGAQWEKFMRKGADRVRTALTETLDQGKFFPREMFANLNASLRSLDKKHNLASMPAALRLNTFCAFPHIAVALYAYYGCDALDEWARRRPIAKASQAAWSPQRESAAAKRCMETYGGLPSVAVLTLSQDPALIGLAQRLVKPGTMEAFCRKHNISRALTQEPAGYWSTQEGIARVSDIYRALCIAKGRYVNDFELSNCSRHLRAEGTPYELELAGNTLRAYIKLHVGSSVAELFKSLCKNSKLPPRWVNQLRTPTTADGTQLDSWSEVRWWEASKVALKQLPADHGLLNLEIIPHPLIGLSGYKSDFALNGVYVEVLRHPLSQIENPEGRDATLYAKKVKVRQEVYREYQLEVLWVEPEMLCSSIELSQHFCELFTKAGAVSVGSIHVEAASDYATGHWFVEENRDNAVKQMLDSGQIAPGRYPAYREMSRLGFGGLTAFLNRSNKDIDKQNEALRVKAICIGTGANKPRLPTKEHVLAVCQKHRQQLLNGDQQVTPASLESVFGFGASAFLNRVEPDFLDVMTKALTQE